MDILQSPNLLLGLIGWAATAKLLIDMADLTIWQRRLMTLFTWLLWMVPAFDVTVYQGQMNTDTAFTYGFTLSIVPILFLSLTAVHWHAGKK
jgi:hypothetical protein